jgi:hypothetical protein
VVTQRCAQDCSDGACTVGATCTPGLARCSGLDVETCNNSGTAWLFRQACSTGCSDGLCGDPCAPGDKRCNGDVPEACEGAAWTQGAACPSGCDRGDCVLSDLVVDGVTQTLEGDLTVQNDVVIKNGGSLRVGPSGSLKIHARNVTIDPGSNLSADDLGDDPRGAVDGGIGHCCAFASGDDCLCPISAPFPDGASYGTAGAGFAMSYWLYCLPAGVSLACAVGGSAGKVYDRDDDLSISKGSSWGAVKGGGLVELVATGTVRIDGQVTANATGTGASGGGIFIAADTVAVDGAIQAKGGTGPAGGDGRVKLLSGTTVGIGLGVTGRTSQSPMPPLDLVSGSHPDPSCWYNDGLGDWYLAWSRPFPTVNGYYYSLTTDASIVPTQTSNSGALYQQESCVVKAKDLVQGSNYFHLVSIDPLLHAGTVKATQKVLINTLPPVLQSPSHPQQRVWTALNSLLFAWLNPVDEGSFTGFYYVLDHRADTVPTATSGTLTTSHALAVEGVADGIWVLHLVSRDTRGATTRAAAHYLTYVGPEPLKSNVSGIVVDASNTPLPDAMVSVNGGLFSVSAPAGAYSFGGTLYAGHWEITASKDGYLPQTKVIDLAAGSPLTEDFVLTKAP